MPPRRFALLMTLGSIPWIAGLAVLGREVGRNWSSWRHHLEYVDYVGAAVVAAAIVYLIVRARRTRPTRGDPAVDAVSE
jgi:membrane protein DedA with SNARE-associated domain